MTSGTILMAKTTVTGFECDVCPSPQQIRNAADSTILKLTKAYNVIEELDLEDVTVENTLMEMIYSENEVSSEVTLSQFLQHVSTDPEVRQASVDAETAFRQFAIEIGYRVKVFNRFKKVDEKNSDELTSEQRRYLNAKLLSGKQNGLHLPAEVQDKVKGKAARIAGLEVTFSSNILEDDTVLLFEKSDLDGAPTDFIESLPKTADGQCKVNLKQPNYFNIMRYCTRHQTRKEFEAAYHSRCKESNMSILAEVLRIRQEMSVLLGYTNFTEFELEKRMSKELPAILSFLRKLEREFKKVHENEYKGLLALKKQECLAQGLKFKGKLDLCDYSHFSTELTKKEYCLDKKSLIEYFPAPTVIRGTLAMYERFLSLKFTAMPDGPVWHDSVQMYKAEDAKDGRLFGYFYLDLYPRPGKFTHAAVKPVQPSCLLKDGTYQTSVCAMVTNFSSTNTNGAPPLLGHSEVATFLHEFGHLVHFLCGSAVSAKLSDYNTDLDFLELPSQAVENLAWDADILRDLSGHYITGEPVPEHLMEALQRSRHSNLGTDSLRQIALALYDLAVHNGLSSADLADTYARIYYEVTGAETTPGTAFPACFDHIVHLGYAAGYYSYLLSDVFASDVYLNHLRGNMTDPEVGMKYRREILEPAGTQDPGDILRRYLGREPSMDAYFKLNNIKSSEE